MSLLADQKGAFFQLPAFVSNYQGQQESATVDNYGAFDIVTSIVDNRERFG
jgi:hypothetical protein